MSSIHPWELVVVSGPVLNKLQAPEHNKHPTTGNVRGFKIGLFQQVYPPLEKKKKKLLKTIYNSCKNSIIRSRTEKYLPTTLSKVRKILLKENMQCLTFKKHH